MHRAPSRRGWTTLIGSALALGALFTLSGCDGRDQAEAQAPASSEVVASSPVPADPVTTEAAPTTEPVASTEPTLSVDPVPSAAPTPTEPPAPVLPPPTTEAAEGVVLVLGIVDGDTIKVRIDGQSTRVRIIGLDAPELGECGYQEGASVVQSLTQSREVRIEADPTQLDTDAYGRLLRHVFTLDGVNVAEEVIAQGFAVEYTYDKPYAYRDDHLAAQARAKDAGLGIWGSLCAQPTAPVGLVGGDEAPDGECLIKGNINRKGERIYHRPDQQHYEKTKIDLSKGERWFCTPEEAEAAGWRASKR